MSVLSEALKAFLDEQVAGVLCTQPAGGRPRQSVVYYVRDDSRLLISTVTDRFKARDVRATGWASLCVHGTERPFPAATFSGSATILTENIGSFTASIMQRMLALDQPPEIQTDEALAGVGRVILAVNVENVSAANYIEGA